MFRSLFSNGLDLDRLSRVWDCWVFENDGILIRAAVSVLGGLETQLLNISPGPEGQKMAAGILGWGAKNAGRKPGRRSLGDMLPLSSSNSSRSSTEMESEKYWNLSAIGDEDAFMKTVRQTGR